MESLSFFTKNEQNSPFSSLHAIILCLRRETDIRTRIISGAQSFYFMIIFFAIERNEEMTSKKCCESI